jgi:hypothetical protein
MTPQLHERMDVVQFVLASTHHIPTDTRAEIARVNAGWRNPARRLAVDIRQ